MLTSTLRHRVIPLLTRSASTMRLAPTRGRDAVLSKSPSDVVFTLAKRTPMGRHTKGQLAQTTVDYMISALLKEALPAARLDPNQIDDICVGTCHPPSPLYVSRAAAIDAGIPADVPISAVNRLCSSGLMAVRHIAHQIQVGEAEVGLAIGVESMSLHPRPTPEVSKEVNQHPQADDCIRPMGWTSEMVAEHYNVSREKQDDYALISHQRTERSQSEGIFADEILPITLADGKRITKDDTPRPGVTREGLAKLKPVFAQWGNGTTTAGNASGVGDGAGVCVMTTRAKAEKEGWDIVGRWLGAAVVGVEPRYMGISPIAAVGKILQQHGLTKDDIDVYEINEAFASQFAYCVEQLQIPIEKINPNGGSIAVSHPLGLTGVRQIATGLAELKRKGQQLLCTSMCIGSGMGAAAILALD